MDINMNYEEKITDQFVTAAMILSEQFPALDLRFNLKNGTSKLRYAVATVSDEIFELDLDMKDTSQIVIEATFTIKEVARLFDA